MLLKVDSVSSYYGQIKALEDVSLHVDKDEIVTLVGANGAGKTTLLNSISGSMHPQEGRITFAGTDVTSRSPESIVGLGISCVPERRQLFASMSVMDNLVLGAYHRYRSNNREEIERDFGYVFDLFPRLQERRKQKASTLSGGEQQMLAIGRALMARPRLLLLDEPSLGLAPLLVRDLLRVIGELRERGTTILLAEQNARAALRVADRGYVLEVGRVVLEGTTEELMDTELVQQAYLGAQRRREHVLERGDGDHGPGSPGGVTA